MTRDRLPWIIRTSASTEEVAKLSPKKCNDILGYLGELLIIKYFAGHEVVHSNDPFDSSKDMTIDGKTVEVKTQMPWISENAYTIRQNQLPKCCSVERLFFVDLDNGHIVESRMPAEGQYNKVNRQNLDMVCIPRSAATNTIIGNATEKQLKIMRPFAVTRYPQQYNSVGRVI